MYCWPQLCVLPLTSQARNIAFCEPCFGSNWLPIAMGWRRLKLYVACMSTVRGGGINMLFSCAHVVVGPWPIRSARSFLFSDCSHYCSTPCRCGPLWVLLSERNCPSEMFQMLWCSSCIPSSFPWRCPFQTWLQEGVQESWKWTQRERWENVTAAFSLFHNGCICKCNIIFDLCFEALSVRSMIVASYICLNLKFASVIVLKYLLKNVAIHVSCKLCVFVHITTKNGCIMYCCWLYLIFWNWLRCTCRPSFMSAYCMVEFVLRVDVVSFRMR